MNDPDLKHAILLEHVQLLSRVSMLAPSPAQVRAARARVGLTQTHAAALIRVSLRAWQNWEAGEREMPVAMFEFFVLLTQNDEVLEARHARLF